MAVVCRLDRDRDLLGFQIRKWHLTRRGSIRTQGRLIPLGTTVCTTTLRTELLMHRNLHTKLTLLIRTSAGLAQAPAQQIFSSSPAIRLTISFHSFNWRHHWPGFLILTD